jgi:hypothetical protein
VQYTLEPLVFEGWRGKAKGTVAVAIGGGIAATEDL